MTPAAIIPAAGRGTRLGERTRATPKCLVPVGGRPVVSWVFDAMEWAGVPRAVVTTGWMADVVESAIPALTSIRVEFVRQEALDGTAGALLAARPIVGDAPFVYSWSDLVYPADAIARLVEAQSPAAMAVNVVDDPTAGAAVTVVSDRVVDIVEKPPRGTSQTPFNSSGMGLLPAEVWPHLEEVQPSSRGEREMTDAEVALIRSGVPMTAVRVEPVFDVGTPERLARAEEWLARG